MPSAWTCIATTTGDVVNSLCNVTATTTGAYTGPNLKEWIFVAMIFLFAIFFSFWPKLFRPATLWTEPD